MLFKIFSGKNSILRIQPQLQSIIFNTGWLFADKILRMGLGLVVGIWIARYLGVKNFGLLNYASAFVALFSPIANLGLDSLVVKEIVRNPSDKEKILGTTFWLKFLSSITCLLLTIICVYRLRQNEPLTIGLVAILATTGIFQAFDTIDLWFQSQVQSKYSVIAKNIAFAIITICKIILITIKAPLIAFVWASSAEFAMGALALIFVYKLQGFSIRLWCWSLPIAKSLVKESLPLLFSGLSIMIYMKIDQIMLGEMINEAAVGLYSAATRISEVWYFIPMAVASSVAPSIYLSKENNNIEYYGKIRKLHLLLIVTAVSIALPMTFLSKSLVILLFGNQYAEAGSILAIHIWAAVFVFMGVATSPWFIAEKLSIFTLYKSIAGGIVNVLLNLLLIPTFVGVGAAWATVISYAISGFLIHAFFPQTRKIFRVQVGSLLPSIPK